MHYPVHSHVPEWGGGGLEDVNAEEKGGCMHNILLHEADTLSSN